MNTSTFKLAFLLCLIVVIEHVNAGNLIPYRKGKQWGFCDQEKNIIIPVKYDSARQFVGKYAPVLTGGKWTFIDSLGNPQNQFQFDRISILGKEFFLVQNGARKGKMKFGVLTKFLTTLIDVKYGMITFEHPIFRASAYDNIYQYDIYTTAGGKLSYSPSSTYHEGLFICSNSASLYGAIDPFGNRIIVPFDYSYLTEFNFGTAVASIGEIKRLIDKKNKTLWESAPLESVDVNNPFGDLNFVKYNYKDKSMKIVSVDGTDLDITSAKYDHVYMSATGIKGTAYAKTKKEFGLLNSKGNFTPICGEGDIRYYGKLYDNRACLNIKGSIGYIDSSGSFAIKPQFRHNDKLIGFDTEFKEGYAMVDHNGKFGVIDINGNAVVPIKYESIERASKDLFLVKSNKQMGYISTSGVEYWED